MRESENVPKTAKKPEAPKSTEKTDTEKPNRNLLFLGLISIGIAIATTALSLLFYHNSGDIYLDRSRPGFLPDKSEVEEKDEEQTEFVFSDSGKITEESLNEYLENLKLELDRLNDYSSDPFGPNPLSDESLGL